MHGTNSFVWHAIVIIRGETHIVKSEVLVLHQTEPNSMRTIPTLRTIDYTERRNC